MTTPKEKAANLLLHLIHDIKNGHHVTTADAEIVVNAVVKAAVEELKAELMSTRTEIEVINV